LNTPSLRLRGSNATLSQSFNSNRGIPGQTPKLASLRHLRNG
jgi:hypothetical protein